MNFLKGLKVKHPAITKVHYFSDGCAAQVKNYQNFINMCFHMEDVGLLAEWNFFVACNGIGITAKHLTLQCPLSNQIPNPPKMFSFCSENIPRIQLYFVPNEAVLNAETLLFAVFQYWSYHQWEHRGIINTFHNQLAYQDCMKYPLKRRNAVVSVAGSLQICTSDVTKGSYFACIYDEKGWFGIVKDISEEFGEFIHLG